MNQTSHPQFRVVEQIPDPLETERPPQPPSPARAQEHAAAIAMIRIALAALSQRAIAGLQAAFTLLTVASVFVLFLYAPPDPSARQLTMLGIYAAFCIIVNALVFWSRRS